MKRLIFILALILVTPLWAGRSFNGSTDIITASGNGTALDISSGSETISLWIYPTTIPSSGEHDALGHGATQVTGVQFEVGFGAYGGSGSAANVIGYAWGCCGLFGPGFGGCGTDYTANNWYQVVIWINTGSAVSGMEVSGPVSCSTSTGYGPSDPRLPSTGNFIIGKGWSGSNFQGIVAEVAVYNSLLSTSQMAALQHVCPVGAAAQRMGFPAPVGYFPLWGASGSSTEPDLSGNKNNGTLTGTSAANHAPCTS
jgi:hypothetical protein